MEKVSRMLPMSPVTFAKLWMFKLLESAMATSIASWYVLFPNPKHLTNCEFLQEEFVHVMSQIELSSNEICGTLLGESCNPVNHPLHNWTLPLPELYRFRKALFFRPFNIRWPFRETKHFKVLQISDIHIDLEYSENSNAVCGEPLCCRASSPGSGSEFLNPRNRAGFWGDYRDCDVPLRTVEETFRFIRNNHPDIDYILWTGDIPPHDIWNQTKQSQFELFDVAANLFNKYFGDIPIFPVVGNHESLPMNR